MLVTNTGLERCRLGIWILSILADIILIIGTLTPAWQVAEDTDVGRYVQSGLWLYCPGAAQCWYIFSDNLINYYERVDVCRFLLIGDCRKKLLRTPYFFGWHYAVLILNLVAICLISCGVAAAALQYKNKERRRIFAILFNAFICMAVLILGISLMVFVINGEMLESKYLIGVRNTFEKYYGYSFYLACTALLMLVFSAFGAILITAFTFFTGGGSMEAAQRHASSITPDYNDETRKLPQEVMLVVHLIVLVCIFSQLHARVVVGDANYYYKVLRLANAGALHSIASSTPSLDRNCFFSPVQCMLPAGGTIPQAI